MNMLMLYKEDKMLLGLKYKNKFGYDIINLKYKKGDIMNKAILSKISLDVIEEIVDTTLAVINPETAILTSGVTVVVKYFVDNKLDKSIKKQKIKEFKKELYNILFESDFVRTLDTYQKDISVKNAIDIIKALEETESINTSTLNMLYDQIYSIVEAKKNNTSEYNKRIYTKIVVYSIVLLFMNLSDKGEFDKVVISSFIELYESHKKLQNDVEMQSKIINESLEKNNSNIASRIIKECAEGYTEVLYLHKSKEFKSEKDLVNLKNLFVNPNIKDLYIKNTDYEGQDVFSYLSSDEYRNSKEPLILLGDAGSGKTSILFKLAYLYHMDKENLSEEEKNDKEKLFLDKNLVIIRLRDLDKNKIRKGEIFKSICEYLGMDCKPESFANLYVILDGMDEISSSEKNIDYYFEFENLLKQFEKAYKLIITSRPSVISSAFNKLKWNLKKIIPFDESKKKQWIKNYESVTHRLINEDIKKYIISNSDSDNKSIFDYPQLMYMIAGENPTNGNWSLDNEWSIYHHIFCDEVLDRNYEQDVINTKPYQDMKNEIYNILQLISYDMYINDSSVRINKNRTDELIKKYTDNGNKIPDVALPALQRYGYRFGCYWKIDEISSEIEFYHNNIRDFFISEYLFNSLNSLFEDIVRNKLFNEPGGYSEEKQKTIEVITKLYGILRGVRIRKEVVWFLKGRAELKNANDTFVDFVKNNTDNYNEKVLKELINGFFDNLKVYDVFSNEGGNLFYTISNFINNFISIVHAIIPRNNWYVFNVSHFFNSEMLRSVYCLYNDSRYINLQQAVLSNMILNQINLENANLYNSILRDAKMSRAVLNGCLFEKSDLTGITLYSAELVDANFSSAILNDAMLANANLTDAFLNNVELCGANCDNTKFKGAELTNSKLAETRFNYSCCDKADFTGSVLDGAEFKCANLIEADFTNTSLVSSSFYEANCSKASFICANLQNAYLREAHLYGCTFSEANMMQTVLYGADLNASKIRGVNFTEAVLCRADLTDATTHYGILDSNIDNATFYKADLSYALLCAGDFSQSDFSYSKLIYSDCSKADFSETKFIEANLRDSNLSKTCFNYSDLRNTILQNANLSFAKLNEVDVSMANLINAKLNYSDLYKAKLSKADLAGADITGANLEGADLEGAYLVGADLAGADLTGANLKRADLTGANLEGADMKYAILVDAKFDMNDVKKANNWEYAIYE